MKIKQHKCCLSDGYIGVVVINVRTVSKNSQHCWVVLSFNVTTGGETLKGTFILQKQLSNQSVL